MPTALAKVKPGAILVKTARGSLVDEDALVEALREGRLFGAGLDVTAQEPLPTSSALLSLENAALTPHVGGAVANNFPRVIERACGNVARAAGMQGGRGRRRLAATGTVVERTGLGLPDLPGGSLPGAVVDGSPTAIHGAEIVVEDPATLDTLAHVAEATAEDVDRVVNSAATAFERTRRDVPGRDRGRILGRIAAASRDAVPELAELESLDMAAAAPSPFRCGHRGASLRVRRRRRGQVYGATIPGEGDY